MKKKKTGQLQTKSSELDVLSTKMLKDFLIELLPSITKLINLSHAQGVFPKIWKKAIVIPLLKKSGFELTFANYRPVSNLSFLSKLIEISALYRLNQHVNENDLLPKNQSAYRQFRSCQSALLRLSSDLWMIIWASTRENLSSVVCEQQRRRPACASAQTDQRLCYSRFGTYHL